MLVTKLGWSLYDIDETDIESLMGFINRLSERPGKGPENKVFCDEAGWL
jgi:hypothetical protein